jgi:hypothetical protein
LLIIAGLGAGRNTLLEKCETIFGACAGIELGCGPPIVEHAWRDVSQFRYVRSRDLDGAWKRHPLWADDAIAWGSEWVFGSCLGSWE